MSNFDFESIVDAARLGLSVGPRVKQVDGVYVAINGNGQVEVFDELMTSAAALEETPGRKTGSSKLTDMASFIAHIERYKDKDTTTIYSDVENQSFVAYYNDHVESCEDLTNAGWADHTCSYKAILSDEWLLWDGLSGKSLSQELLGEILDERSDDLVSADGFPEPIVMLELSRDLQIYTNATHARKMDKATGEYSLVSKLEHTSESTKIPKKFCIAVRIFEGGDLYHVEVRVKFKMLQGSPSFTLSIHRGAELVKKAFGEVRDTVIKETGIEVFSGTR